MSLGSELRKYGFRKWYERELLAGHAHLVLTFMCLVGVFAAFEAFSVSTSKADRLIDAAAIAACMAIGVWALRRYLYLLMHAESAARQAVCPACKAYGRFHVDREDSEHAPLQVRCKGCNQSWQIVDEGR